MTEQKNSDINRDDRNKLSLFPPGEFRVMQIENGTESANNEGRGVIPMDI